MENLPESDVQNLKGIFLTLGQAKFVLITSILVVQGNKGLHKIRYIKGSCTSLQQFSKYQTITINRKGPLVGLWKYLQNLN